MTTLLALLLGSTAILSLLAGCQDSKPNEADVAEASAGPLPGAASALEEARAALRAGKLQEAVGLAYGVAKKDPGDYEARLVLTNAYLMAGKVEAALVEANAALEIDATRPDGWIAKALVLSTQGKLDRAITLTQKALKLDHNNRAALTNLASFQGREGDWLAQASTLETLIAVDPANLNARVALAKNFIARDNLPAAMTAARDVVKYDPRNLEAQLILTTLAWDRMDYDGTLERAKIALTIQSDHPLATRLLEASFYVLAAAELRCKAGERPWSDDALIAVLKGFATRGLEGVETFEDFDATFKDDADVQARVEAAARGCR